MEITKTNVRPLLKRAIAVFMAVLMVMSTLGVGLAFAAEEGAGAPEVLTNGNCGMYESCGEIQDNVKWELYDNGTLYIFGEGLMKGDYSPWCYYERQNDFAITEIIIGEGITDTRGYAFDGMENVKTVSLPATLERIGCDTFWGCSSLETINIPAKVRNISDSAFAYCSSLKEFTVDEENEYYRVDEYGVLYYGIESDDYRSLLAYPCGSEAEEYTVLADVDHVDYCAFRGTENLKVLTVESADTYVVNLHNTSIEEVVGYLGSSAYFAALEADIPFTSINGATVTNAELTHLPYKLECEIYEGLDLTGTEITVYLSDGSTFCVYDGNYLWYECDTSKLGKQTVKVYFLGEEFTFDITVLPQRHLILGNEVSFNSYNGSGENFYFTPSKTGEYIFTVGPVNSYRDVSFSEKFEETYEEDGENYTEWWWEWIDEYYFHDGDKGTVSLELEAGKEYRIRTWISGDENTIPSTIKVMYNCTHKNQKVHAQQNATCTAGGYTKGIYCEDCKTWISGHAEIAALGHNTNLVKVTKAATCAADGVKTYSCSTCGAKVKDEKIAATGAHTSDGGKVTKEATYDAAGVKTYTCTVCKKVIKTEAIAKLVKPVTEKPADAAPVQPKVKKPAKAKIKSAKSTAKKKVVVSWNKVKNANGYQVAYSTSKKFQKKATKTKLIKKVKTTKLTIKKLKSGKKYFIKVRAFKNVKGKKLYGAYSKVKTVKVK